MNKSILSKSGFSLVILLYLTNPGGIAQSINDKRNANIVFHTGEREELLCYSETIEVDKDKIGLNGFKNIDSGSFENGKLRSKRYQSMTKDDAALWQKELRTKLFDVLQMDDLVSEDTDIPLNIKTISSTDEADYISYEKEMNSTMGRRIKFVITIPGNQKGPFPAIIFLAGHGGSCHSVYKEEYGYYNIGRHLASDGFVTLSVKISQHDIYELGRTNMGERLWDLMRCVDYLFTCDFVDTKRVGCGGKSLGAEMAMWLGAMDERIKASLVAGFLTSMDQMEKNHCMCWKFPGLRELVDYADIYSLIAPRALCFLNGLDEPSDQFPPSVALPVFNELAIAYMDWEIPENVSLVVHKGGHIVNVPCVLEFFDQHLRKELKMTPFSERTRL